MEFLLVGLGGALGAIARFAVMKLDWFSGDRFLLTMIINLSGCLLIGVVWALLHHVIDRREVYLFVVAGLLGGYTTYSTFGYETLELIRGGQTLTALLYVATTVVGGLACCAAGYTIVAKFAAR